MEDLFVQSRKLKLIAGTNILTDVYSLERTLRILDLELLRKLLNAFLHELHSPLLLQKVRFFLFDVQTESLELIFVLSNSLLVLCL